MMKIDFVSDVACPWCAVGLNALERALTQLADDPQFSEQVTIEFQPFELNPAMPPEGEDTVEHLARKYGIDAAQIRRNQDALRQRGAAVGFEFGERKRIHNTFDAHRLLMWAGDAAPAGSQRLLKHALLGAYFTRGLNPADIEVLVGAAVEAGLDGEAARALLAGNAYRAEVREREAMYQQAGIHSVPAVIINNRHLISGGQPPEVFAAALRQIAAGQAGG
jgi:predicted DsbA family dithiol-disulfide isomerase